MSEQEPGSLERGLRTASDSLLATLDELYSLEERKRRLQPGTDQFVELASRVEALANVVLAHSHQQGVLAEVTRDAVVPEDPAQRSIEQVPPRDIHAILSEWRAAERRLGEAEAGSEAADLAAADVRRLRDEYRRARERAERDS